MPGDARRVDIQVDSWSSFLKMYQKNLEKGGLGFSLPDDPPKLTDMLEVVLHLPDESRLSFWGEVKYVSEPESEDNPHKRWAIGVVFFEMDGKLMDAVHKASRE